MATILLAAAGAAIGGGFGGTVLGLSGAVIGRAIGATLGRAIDQRLLGQGARAVETGRIDRLRLQTAGEGRPVARVWGQMRVPGHVIWAAPLREVSRRQGGGKGSGARVTEFSYEITCALALCEGEILGIGRIWADGEEVGRDDLNLRIYRGDEAQLPDPAITAHEGEGAPAYRGIAYVVLEGLNLQRWGNRLPQLSFEVTRAAKGGNGLSRQVRAVAMIPGTGEYTLATQPVRYDFGLGEALVVNENTAQGAADFQVSLDQLGRELPGVGSVSLVVSWFGDDLRAGRCQVKPKVESNAHDGKPMRWRAGGITRAQAEEVAQKDGRPIYGGTPADASVVQALAALKLAGKKAVFYPFILMEQGESNGLRDPWSGADHQPVMPWRGRITTEIAPGREGSTDGSAEAEGEVARFFGTASRGDFRIENGQVVYSGPDEWSLRRFILHYAHLCALAGGVDAFLIGSEMVSLTQIRGAGNSYPAVAALRALAADVRAVLPGTKISYAADWSEYFGHHPGNGELFFHLDPLWADRNIDFIGIDNYMPLSDWRDGEDHADAHWGRIDNPAYLRANVAGGEGFDWYYADQAHRDAQIRTPITDGAYGEEWVWRYKDIRGWWENKHFERPGGEKAARPTAWVPGSKPIWFTEMGCAALDKATNQPNKFLDMLSSESTLPHYSDGRRDDAIQAAYIKAMVQHWSNAANNPVRDGIRMVDMARAHVWAWDARPFPAFPARTDLWSDGPAWARGHWLNGRAGAQPLGDVVAEICDRAGVAADVSALSGVVRGYALSGVETGRAALQPLMLAYGFDAVERDGALRFVMRGARVTAQIGPDDLADADDVSAPQHLRAPEPELAGRVRLSFVEAGADYAARTVEALLPGDDFAQVAQSELTLALTPAEGQALAERWLAEARVARDSLRIALPPSLSSVGPGDVLGFGGARWRVDRAERAGAVTLDAVRVEPGVYRPADTPDEFGTVAVFTPPVPVWPVFLDLPLMRGDEVPHAPHLAVTATPWSGAAAAWSSDRAEGGFSLNRTLPERAVMGVTQTPLYAARAGAVDRGEPLRLRLKGGALNPASWGEVLAGANLIAVGDGSAEGWELIQFAKAQLVSADVWEISERLRGQAGTDAQMPEVWPAGSVVVVLDGAAKQVDVPPSARGLVRHWRIGPASRPPEDGSYTEIAAAFRGAGLRPYAPCHLRVDARGYATWVRRTRIGGDGWDGVDVPLGEDSEQYHLRLMRAGDLLFETTTNVARFTVPETVWAQARASGAFQLEVAQLSGVFGAGFYTKCNVEGSNPDEE